MDREGIEQNRVDLLWAKVIALEHENLQLKSDLKILSGAMQKLEDKIRKPVIINGKRFFKFEDWQLLGRPFDLTAKVEWSKYVEFGDTEGFEARAVVLRGDGEIISAAESMVLRDEKGVKHKPLYQIRSKAQTRACSKALRNVLAWIPALAGFETTPAEEMENHNETRQNELKKPKKAVIPNNQVDFESRIYELVDKITNSLLDEGITPTEASIFKRATQIFKGEKRVKGIEKIVQWEIDGIKEYLRRKG